MRSAQIVEQERVDWDHPLDTPVEIGNGRLDVLTFSRAGGEALVDAALYRFIQAVRQMYVERECDKGQGVDDVLFIALPHNLAKFGPALRLPREGSVPDPWGDLIGAYAGFAGFLNAIARDPRRFPLLVRVLCEGTSAKGMNSPRTVFNPWDLYRVWRSPGACERGLWKIRLRANQILKPYSLKGSIKALGRAAACGRRTGKGALRAAGWSVMAYADCGAVAFDYPFTSCSITPLAALMCARHMKAQRVIARLTGEDPRVRVGDLLMSQIREVGK